MKNFFAALAVVLVAWVGCATPAREPANLDQPKDEIRRYVDSGEYQREIATVAAEARAWVETRVGQRKAGEKLAMVFDLDETLLSNLPFMLDQDLGGSDAAWDTWDRAGQDPAIEPVRDVYRAARRLGVEVIFITGRREHLRAATEENLRTIDCGDYAALIFKPEAWKGNATDYKTAQRKRFAAEGHTIIANIGDQESDLAGGFAERTFKLPDPFYFTP